MQCWGKKTGIQMHCWVMDARLKVEGCSLFCFLNTFLMSGSIQSILECITFGIINIKNIY